MLRPLLRTLPCRAAPAAGGAYMARASCWRPPAIRSGCSRRSRRSRACHAGSCAKRPPRRPSSAHPRPLSWAWLMAATCTWWRAPAATRTRRPTVSLCVSASLLGATSLRADRTGSARGISRRASAAVGPAQHRALLGFKPERCTGNPTEPAGNPTAAWPPAAGCRCAPLRRDQRPAPRAAGREAGGCGRRAAAAVLPAGRRRPA